MSKILKYLSGEMENKEADEYKKMINKSEKDKSFFNNAKKDWEMLEKYEETEKFNTDSAWNKLYDRFEKEDLINDNKNVKKIDFYYISKIAAIFIVGLLLSYFVFNISNDSSKEGFILAETFQSTDIKIVELGDGSTVYLNVNSKLYYPEQFDSITRVVEFEGEAFFEIAKNPNKPFIIKYNDTEVKVLGTSFNINTNFKGEKLEVTVKTGKVKLYNSKNEKKNVVLEKGFVGTLSDDIPEKHENKNKFYLSWKTKHFEFNGETLQTVIEVLNKAYNVSIITENDFVANKVINTTFDNHELKTIFEFICAAHNLKVEEQNDKFVLKAK